MELIPITDEDGPGWVRKIGERLVALATEMAAGMASSKGVHADAEEDDPSWVYVITAAKFNDQWQVHACWVTKDGVPHECSYGVVLGGDGTG